MHRTIDPGILYFGTPVVLVSSLNEDGSANLAPMSSAWWLGRRCLLGFGARSKTPQNILRTGECVLNLPSPAQVSMVDRIALTTGSNPMPERKERWGYRYEREKFARAGMTEVASTRVRPPRAGVSGAAGGNAARGASDGRGGRGFARPAGESGGGD